ncbi:response regulator transcription factor [Lentzea flava]|uniref:response regulator transcription factor n=1 Tax=Lentzea flava TaxID=103732 RepID=UPI001E38BEA0|nr:response regulator transcription factor [Lentzea flava]
MALPSATATGRPRRTCSDKCRSRARRDRERQTARSTARQAGRCETALAGHACDRPAAFVLVVDGTEMKVCRTCREPTLALLVGQGVGATAIEVRAVTAERMAPAPDSSPSRTVKVLLIEDDDRVSSALVPAMQRRGFDIRCAATGKDGLRDARLHDFDVVLLDLGLPDMDGIEVLRRLNRTCDTPVIVVTARSEESARILGLSSGAADYLVKPYDFGELIVRIRKAVRAKTPLPGVYEDAVLRVDLLRREVHVGGHAVALTSQEFKVLTLLIQSPGVPVATETIHAHLTRSDTAAARQSRLVTVYIGMLRNKISVSPLGRDLIVNVRGIGYSYQPPRTPATTSRIGYSHADRFLATPNPQTGPHDHSA